MKLIKWSPEKAKLLKQDTSRGGVTFEDCIVALEEGRLLADIENPSEKHSNQRMLIIEVNAYAYAVPYVETEDEIFLKTIFPSRKLTAIYLVK